MVLNYLSTCHTSSAVKISIACNFTSSRDLNLIVAKDSQLEIFTVLNECLSPKLQVTVNGRITNLVPFRRKSESRDFLVMLTESLNFSIIEYSSTKNAIRTRCSGNINDNLRRCEEGDPIVRVDPTNTYALVRVFNGVIKIIAIDHKQEGFLNMYNIKLNELYTYDVTFLPHSNSSNLHIGLIYKDHLSRHFRSYLIRVKDMELRNGPLSVPSLDDDACLIIPSTSPDLPVILVGRTTLVSVLHEEINTCTPPDFIGDSPILYYTPIARKRSCNYLITDMEGNLYVLNITKDMRVFRYGKINPPSSLTYLDNGVVFVGSSLADSQLIRLEKNIQNSQYFTVLDTYLNIGPIVDMQIYDRNKQDVPRLITCSGHKETGSLRILTNGVQLQHHEFIKLTGFQSVFSLIFNNFNGFDDSFILSSSDSSIFVILNPDDSYSVSQDPLFEYNCQTVFAGNVVHDQILQITTSQIRLINIRTKSVTQTIDCSNSYISNYACSGYYFAVSSFDKFVLYEITDKGCEVISKHQFSNDISCFSFHHFERSDAKQNVPNVLAITTWNDASIKLFSLPEYELISSDTFESYSLFKSVEFVKFKQDSVHLFCGSITGDMYIYEIRDLNNPLCTRTRVHLGTSFSSLYSIRLNGARLKNDFVPGGKSLPESYLGDINLLCCSDRASLLYFSMFRLSFSYTNMEGVISCSTFHKNSSCNFLFMMTHSGLVVGQISNLCSYNICSIPIYESPVKIAYQFDSSSFGLITHRPSSEKNEQSSTCVDVNLLPYSLRVKDPINKQSGEEHPYAEIDYSNFIILDHDTFEPLAAYLFPPLETAFSLYSCSFGLPFPYYAVGTGIADLPNQEANRGSVILFQYCDRKLVNISDYPTKGSVFSVVEQHSKLICTTSHSILVLSLRTENELICLHDISNHVTALFCSTLEDRVVIGDLIRGLSVYSLTSDGAPELQAKSSETNWVTSMEIINDSNFVYGNMEGQLYISSLPVPFNFREDRIPKNLNVTLCYNLDQQINVFQRGSLLYENHPQKEPLENKNSVMFGTVSGMLGVLLEIPEPWNKTLLELQKNILDSISSVGDIDYYSWRNQAARRYETNATLIDGDIIENFLQLYPGKFKEILSVTETHLPSDMTFDTKFDLITSFISGLSRYH